MSDLHDHRHDHHLPWPEASGRVWLRIALWLSLSALALWIVLGGHSDLYVAANVRWTLWLAIVASLAIAALDGAPLWWPLIMRWRMPPTRSLSSQGGHALAVPYLGTPLRNIASSLRARPDLALLFVPVALGIAMPPAVLGAGSILAHDGVVALVGAPAPGTASGAIGDATVLQLQYRAQRDALISGTAARITGFVLDQPGLPQGTWLLVRFATPHCVAEAQPVGLVVRPGAGMAIRAPPNNAWVTVSGQLVAGTVAGKSVAVLEATQIKRITTPPDPYLIS